jgi:hypothetical protein
LLLSSSSSPSWSSSGSGGVHVLRSATPPRRVGRAPCPRRSSLPCFLASSLHAVEGRRRSLREQHVDLLVAIAEGEHAPL